MKRFGILVASFALLLLVGGGCATKTDNNSTTGPAADNGDTGPIVVGWVGPLTGDAVIYGDPIRNSVDLAVKEVNDAGGVDGRMLEVIHEDGRCSGKDASSAAQKLLSVDNVSLIIGGVCSGETLAMAPLTEGEGKILFSPSATSPDIKEAGDFVFRNVPADDLSGKALAKLVNEKGATNVAIVTENTDFADGVYRVFKDAYEGEFAVDERYNQEAKDFRDIVTKIKGSDADAVVVNPQTSATGAVVVKQLRELGVELPVYTTSVMADDSFLEIAGDAAEGVLLVDVPGLNEENQKANDFLANYEATYGEAPGFPFYSGSGYDAVYILKDAIESAGLNAEGIRDYLYGLERYDGVIGVYSFDEYGDLQGIDYLRREVKDGVLVVVE